MIHHELRVIHSNNSAKQGLLTWFNTIKVIIHISGFILVKPPWAFTSCFHRAPGIMASWLVPRLLGSREVHCHPWRQAIRPLDSPGQRETGRAERH